MGFIVVRMPRSAIENEKMFLDYIFSSGERGFAEMTTDGVHSVIRKSDGVLVGSNMSLDAAQKMRKTYRNFFGGAYDIIETSTTDFAGNTLFSGDSQKFSHEPIHRPIDVPVWDIFDKRGLVAANVRENQVQDILDMSPNFYSVKYIPVQNNAPVPVPGKSYNWKTKKIAKDTRKTKISEVRYTRTTTPELILSNGYAIVDVATLDILHEGARDSATEYMATQRNTYKIPLYKMRIIKRKKLEKYIEETRANGYIVKNLGQVVCIGNKQECSDFVQSAITDGKMNIKNVEISK